MSNSKMEKIHPIRRTAGGAIDTDYYYRLGKQRHDEELNQAMRQMIKRMRSAVRAFFRGRTVGSFLNLERTWQI